MRLTTFVLLADPQIGGIANDTADYAKQMGIMSNLNQELNNIHTYPFPLNNENITLLGIKRSEYINQPDAVFFAGDLTQYGGSIGLESWAFPTKNAANWQGGEKLWNFRILYDPEHPREGITQLNNCGPVYFSLGNHDLETATGESYPFFGQAIWPDFDGKKTTDPKDYYRYQMWNFINQMHVGYNRTATIEYKAKPPFPIPLENIDADPQGTFQFQHFSFNYVVDMGPVDVYQLQQFGGDSTFGRKSGLDWLKRRLAKGGYTRPVIVIQHISFVYCDSYYGFSNVERDELLAILRPYNVIAMLVGHSHSPSRVREVKLSPSATSISGVKNDHRIWELRPGAALLQDEHPDFLDNKSGTRFGVIRVEEPDSANEVITNVLYGTVKDGETKFKWQYGWSNRTSKSELYLQDIEIIYRDSEADDLADDLPWYVTEETSKSANINHGFGGKYVYIKPVLTSNAAGAATGFDLAIRDKPYDGPNVAIKNLAEGAGGKYRYLVPKYEAGKPPIRQLWLWRADGQQAPKIGWSLVGNINEGRGGDALYLEWDARG